METIKWFDRQFSFNHTPDEYPEILERLKAAPKLLVEVIGIISESQLTERANDKWSIKEHIGHLFVLEPLWRDRIIDIQSGKKRLTPTDLENTATSEGGFNEYPLQELIAMFTDERTETVRLLSTIELTSVTTTSEHPRMKQQLGIIDHLYFVAEHDDHHINHIRELKRKYLKSIDS